MTKTSKKRMPESKPEIDPFLAFVNKSLGAEYEVIDGNLVRATKEYYADYDEETALYCVFDTESSKACSSWSSMEQAKERADEMNSAMESK